VGVGWGGGYQYNNVDVLLLLTTHFYDKRTIILPLLHATFRFSLMLIRSIAAQAKYQIVFTGSAIGAVQELCSQMTA
jgi:hypothetical protein